MNHRKGFTLAEVVVAIFLLTIVWLAMIGAIIVSNTSGSLAKHKVQAMYVMQQTIENLRKLTFSSIGASTTTVTIDTRGTVSAADDLKGTQYVTIPSSTSYYKKVLVEIDWQESFFGKSKTVKEYCGTYIANDSQAN